MISRSIKHGTSCASFDALLKHGARGATLGRPSWCQHHATEKHRPLLTGSECSVPQSFMDAWHRRAVLLTQTTGHAGPAAARRAMPRQSPQRLTSVATASIVCNFPYHNSLSLQLWKVKCRVQHLSSISTPHI